LGMPAVTERTITNLGALLRDLALTRERGYAVDDGEQEVGVRCVAVPLRGAPTPAAVSVSGPEGRVLPLFTSDGVVDRMRAVADRLTAALLDGQPGA
ncbi:MAG TPA: IclR family transcriptional regulator C-terminal domain-containing protein, partial [Rugosimonospora sp.]|nr:IclR family transcriptional regulator C-terminal domain-containing protein [Rugosimonospora sp.]